MQFTSLRFLLFMLVTAAVEFLLPKKVRTKWLFAASIVFYTLLDLKFVPLLAAVVLTAYLGGLAIKAEAGKGRNAGFAVSVITEIALLIIFRSAGIFTKGHIWIVPVGISFYILQAVGYLIDVRRGTVEAERNLTGLGLFISFFPQLTSGPIERAPHMLPQFKKGPDGYDPVRIRDGALYMLWGYFLKMVIADRIAVLTGTFYDAPGSYGGAVAFICAVLYMIQLYCDFAGYSSIAIGAAKVLGIELMQNFNSPFLAGTVAEYWHRWHTSLSTWLRDYVYIPLGGSRKGTGRKYINILLTFLVSGLWHGTGWNFLLWGLVFGLLQVAGGVLAPVRDRLVSAARIDRQMFSHRVFKIAVTFTLVCMTFVLFRASSVRDALAVYRSILHPAFHELTGGVLTQMGLGMPDMVLLLFSLAVMVFADICRYNGISLADRFAAQSLPFRWFVYIAAVLMIAVCGIWGPGFSADSFIYAHF